MSYIVLALGTIALGLAVHWRGGVLSPAVRDVIGDALWAAMIYWWLGALAPRATLRARMEIAIVICYSVELSQLYHSPAVDRLRATTIGGLVFGSGFDPRDLAAYTAGVLVAVGLDRFVASTLVRRDA